MITPQVPKQICSGFQFVEGPVWVADGSLLLGCTDAPNGALIFSDIPASTLYWFADGKTGVVRESTGQANGNALDFDGMLLSCEHDNRRVSRLDGNGQVRCIVDRHDGKRLNSPNDVVVRSDGAIFFTDPPYGVSEDHREIGFQGVYCIPAGHRDTKLIAADFVRPNGLAFSGDEQLLYVADTEQCHLRSFSVDSDGCPSQDRIFCECERPDGLCLDVAGNVWVACMQGVEAFAPDGRRIAYFSLPERPANLAFGGDDMMTLFVCARTSIYTLRSNIPGALGRPREHASGYARG